MLYALTDIAIILMLLFVAFRLTRGGVVGLYTKTIASLAFVVLGLYGAYASGLTIIAVFMLLGLIFGMLGDIVLDLKVVYSGDKEKHLNAGMLCFGAGHIMYFIALSIFVVNSFALYNRITTLLLVPLGIALLITTLIMFLAKPLLKLDFGNFKIQTALYTFALTFMTAYAFVAGYYVNKILLFAVGLLFIFLSDLVLSNQYFGGKQNSKVLTAVNHILYYLGQILIALMIYFL